MIERNITGTTEPDHASSITGYTTTLSRFYGLNGMVEKQQTQRKNFFREIHFSQKLKYRPSKVLCDLHGIEANKLSMNGSHEYRECGLIFG